MGIITKPYTFASGRIVDGTQINANFDALYTAVGGAVLTTDARLSDARVASDVSAWAKAATKPAYASSEITNISAAGQALIDDADAAAQRATLGGVVVGPASATDNAIVRFDAATGKLVQNSSVTIDDGGNIVMPNDGAIGQAEGPLVAFDDTNNYLEITGCNVGIGTPTPAYLLTLGVSTGDAEASTTALAITTNGEYGYSGGGGAKNLDLDFVGNQGKLRAKIRSWDDAAMTEDGELTFHTGASGTLAENMRIRANGDIWGIGNISGLSFTDRTSVYEGDAVAELIKVKGVDGLIDHSTLPAFARHVTTLQVASETEKDKNGKAVMVETQEEGRDLGAMISMLTVAIKQLNDRLLAVEKKGN